MTWSVVDTGGAFDDTGSSVSTLDVAVTGVSSGDSVIAWTKWEGADTTATVSDTGSTDDFTAGTKENHTNGDLNGQFFYLLSATVTGAVTYRLTFSAARPYCRLIIMVFNPDAGDTVSLEAQNIGEGTSTTPTSGGISPSGTDLVCVGGFGEYTASNPSNNAINSSTTGVVVVSSGTQTEAWYKFLTSGFTNGNASGDSYASDDWICNIICLTAVAAGGATALPFRMRR